jgi:two-component system chemotaxis sensor kinase CheA
MQNIGKLTEFIEQASLAINMLSPTDMSGLESLQEIFDQISRSIDDIGDAPAQLLTQVKGTTSNAVDMLQKILQQEVEDTANSIEIVSKAISTLESLIGQFAQAKVTPDSAAGADASEGAETAPQEVTVVREEDMPLVLDFIAEAQEHIESAEAGLLELESKPQDKEILNQIFRAFHTIKGMAGFLNLGEIGSLAHSAENLLDFARKGELVLTGKNMDVVFESVDLIKKMIECLKVSAEAGEPVPKQQQLPTLLAKLKAVSEKRGRDSAINFAGGTPDGDAKLDAILADTEQSTEEIVDKAKIHTVDTTIKVNTTRLDNLINMVGELVIAQLMIAEDVNIALTSEQNLGRKVAHQSKIIRELQELSMSMRMVPISGVFQKMTRLVRDLSHKAGKNINLSVSGEDTELDRNIVDKIADPLVHMIRNSIDHGIEMPQDRIQAGKNKIGQIKLLASHQSGNIVIEIEDDGKGLNKEGILKKAVENGIVSRDQQLSEQEIFKLIFHAGLSTAEKVTSVSGRGVGMDVVKKNIESLRGKIDISSIPGKGATFTIRLPLTLAIIDGQIIKVGPQRYILPISSIVQSFKPTAKQVSTVQNRGEMVLVRGQLLPLVRLHRIFNIESSVDDITKALLVIVEEDNKKCCLLVDELLGQQQVVIKSLGDGLSSVKGVSGGAIMGDGKISLILDVTGLIGLTQN